MRDIITQKYENGGLGMIDILKYDRALKLCWMNRIVRMSELNIACRGIVDIDTTYFRPIRELPGYGIEGFFKVHNEHKALDIVFHCFIYCVIH